MKEKKTWSKFVCKFMVNHYKLEKSIDITNSSQWFEN